MPVLRPRARTDGRVDVVEVRRKPEEEGRIEATRRPTPTLTPTLTAAFGDSGASAAAIAVTLLRWEDRATIPAVALALEASLARMAGVFGASRGERRRIDGKKKSSQRKKK